MHFSSDSKHLKHCRQENLSEQSHFSLWLSYALLMLIKYAVVNVLGHLVSRIQVLVSIKGREENMSRFAEDEVKTMIRNVMTLLNEGVFGTIHDFFANTSRKKYA